MSTIINLKNDYYYLKLFIIIVLRVNPAVIARDRRHCIYTCNITIYQLARACAVLFRSYLLSGINKKTSHTGIQGCSIVR